MYNEFSIIAIQTDIKDKKIIIETNKDILKTDPELIVQVYERNSKTHLDCTTIIEKNNLFVTLNDWPIPNTEYIISIKNLKSVMMEKLSANLRRRVVFKSNVLSNVSILSPAMFETVNSLAVKLNEFADNQEQLVNKYYIEIATDNAFTNIEIKTSIQDKNLIYFELKKNGQYFIRARVQESEENYSKWSDTISFIYNANLAVKEDIDIDDIDIDIDSDNKEEDDFSPVLLIDELFDVEDNQEQGCTPKEPILFAFNHKLDEDYCLQNSIVFIRKKEVK